MLKGEAAWGQVVTTMRVMAAPEVILADGTSTSIIRADVRDEFGRAVPDGTEVLFQSSLGTIPPRAETVGGIAQAPLLSSTAPGLATVTASHENVRSQVEVEFVEEEAIASGESNVITLDAGWIGYYAKERVVVALQDARLSFRDWDVRAKTSLYLDVDKLEVLAKDAQISSRVGKAEGFCLRAKISGFNFKGHILKVGEETALYKFEGRSLELKPAPEALSPELFWPPQVDENSFWIKGDHMLLFPGEKIALRGAKLYLGGSKVLTFPYYVLPLDQSGVPSPDYVSYNSLGGLSVNVPFYYAVSPDRTGLVRLQKGEQNSWFSQRPGWSLGLEEGYSSGPDVEGTVQLEGLSQNDWGAYWRHHRRFGDDSDAYLSLSYPSHQLLNANLAWYGRKPDYTFAAQADATKAPGQDLAYNLRNSWRTFTKPLGVGKWHYYGAFDLGLQNVGSSGAVLEQQEGVSLFPQQVRLGKSSELSYRTDLSFLATSAGTRGIELRNQLSLDRDLGRGSNLSLSYVYDGSRGGVFAAFSPRHQINASLIWGGSGGANAYANAAYDFQNSLSAYGSFAFPVSQGFKLGLRSQYFKYEGGNYIDNEVSLAKNIGGRALALSWAQSRHQIWFEFLPQGY